MSIAICRSPRQCLQPQKLGDSRATKPPTSCASRAATLTLIIRQLPLARAYVRDLAAFAGPRFPLILALIAGHGVLEFVGLGLLGALLLAAGLGASGPMGAWFHWPLGLGPALGLFVGARLVQLTVRRVIQGLQSRLDADFARHLRTRFYQAAMDADWLFLTKERSSDFTQAQLEELPRAGLCTQHLLNLAATGAVVAVQVALALYLSPFLTLGVLGVALATAFGLRTWQRHQDALNRLLPAQRADLAPAVTEQLGGLKLAKSFGRTEAHAAHFRRALQENADFVVRTLERGATLRFGVELTTLLTLGACAGVALLWQPVGLGGLLLLGFVFSRLLTQAAQLHASWQQLAVNLLSYAATEQRRARYLAAAEPADASETRLPLQHELRFTEVTFRYGPERAPAVADLDFALPARSVTALCGRSGAGKSTTADLALGLLQPTTGQILLDGVPLDGARRHAWRRSIGYVPQETFLFHDTIRANLLWAQPDATADDLACALQAAAAAEFVARLPQGLDTVVGDRGLRLSGGERQRLALARALLRRPALLVLDEATSSLDPENERFVQDALERLRGETTILVIAHRLSTVRAADRIHVLADGRLVESGSWAELVARDQGVFRALVDADARA